MSNEAIDLVREELTKKSIPLNELIGFKSEIENAIKILQEDMIKQFRETALANGIGLDFLAGELVKSGIEKEVGSTPNKKPAKYKNPNDENQTWCGIGKRPNWIEEWTSSGKSLDDLLINR